MKAQGLAPLVMVCAILAASATAGFADGYDELNAGITAFVADDGENALAHFSRALASGELNTDQQYVAYYDRAVLESGKGQLDQALSDFKICIGLRPDENEAVLARGRLYQAAGKLDLALADANTALAINPIDTQPYMLRQVIYSMQDEPTKRMADLKTLKTMEAGAKWLDFEIAIGQFELDDAADAKAGMVQLIDAYPGYAWLWLALSNAKLHAGPPSLLSRMYSSRWPSPLVDFYNGSQKEAEVMKAAAEGTPAQQPNQKCEAEFFVGEWHRLHDGGGNELLQKATLDCPPSTPAARIAREDLKNVSSNRSASP